MLYAILVCYMLYVYVLCIMQPIGSLIHFMFTAHITLTPKSNQVSSDNQEFEVPIHVARLSKTVDQSIPEDDDEAEDEIVPLINVKADVLGKIIEFCTHYVNVEEMTEIHTPLTSTRVDDLVQKWYVDFCDTSSAGMDDKMLFGLVTAADYMNIQPIMDLACLKVAVLMKGKSRDEIHRMFPSNKIVE